MTYKFTPKTFDECYKELSAYLYDRGIATEKVEDDPVYELAKTYALHEQRTFEEEHDEPSDQEMMAAFGTKWHDGL